MCSPALGQTATTTSLAVSSGGAAVTTVTAGNMVTLTASVVAGSATVKQGQVKFCDATAPRCSDIHLLGLSQLSSTGKAVLHLRPGAGSYSYNAEFLGTPKSTVPYAGSVSTASNLTVTGPIATWTMIAQSGPSGNYTLSASVYGFWEVNQRVCANRNDLVSGYDDQQCGAVDVNVDIGWHGPFFVNVSNPAVGSVAGAIVAGDFNGDGNLDLAVGISSLTSTVAILLGEQP